MVVAKIPANVLEEMFPKRLKRVILAKEVSVQLKNLILSGKLKKGERLIQEKIALKFGVSKGTVTLALRRLIEEGLVIGGQGEGWFVK